MKQQDWTDELRQRLSDYEEPVPEGLWDDIEQRIQRRPRLVVLRRWMAGAAAVALLLVGGWQLLSPSVGIESTAEEALLAQAEDMESPEPPSSNVTQQEATDASATSTALPERRTLSTQRGETTEATPVAKPSQETTRQDVSSQEPTRQDASSQETTQQDAPSQETTRQETPSQETTRQETQSQ